MHPYSYAPYPYTNGAAMPVRYMIPPGYGQNSPPFANQSFDRYAAIRAQVGPPQNPVQPLRYPPGYMPGYVPPNMQMPPGSAMMPVGTTSRGSPYQQQQRVQPEQLQPPQPYYYNPYGPNGANPPPKKGAKEYKDNAFTIAPDGAHSETIKGLVSNNDINDLLKHKGTKVKVSKIYRITKTKPDIVADDSSDEELSHPPPIEPPRSQTIQRPVSSSSSSSNSHCSTCSNCSCSDCRNRSRSHVDDDCPECRAERKREQSRRQRRK